MASKKCYVWLRKLISLFENYGIAGWLSIKFLCVTLWHMSISAGDIAGHFDMAQATVSRRRLYPTI